MEALPLIMMGTQVAGGIAEKNAANKAAEAARRVGEFNAQIIERDVNLLENQRTIINNNLLISNKRKRMAFREAQGEAVAGFAYAGVDIAVGTPMEVLRRNGRESDFEIAVDKFNNYVTNMQINDAQEDARLTAQLSRMEAGASAAALRSQGTASLIAGFGSAARIGFDTGYFKVA
tara:strand:- start:63 stop:590 length:528 start_codon:yes stop_codon:yes gene_type:complete